MKKIFSIISLALVAVTLVGCSDKKPDKHFPWEKDKDKKEVKETDNLPKDNPQDIVMNEIAPATRDINGDAEVIGNANYQKLMSIAEKCEADDFTLADLSPSDYTFMIDFCNMMMDSAEEADRNNVGQQWLSDNGELMQIVVGFTELLGAAYQEGMLDSRNSHDFELMLVRAQRMAES